MVTLGASDRSLTLNQSQDYVVECPSGQFDVPGKITIWGGHNVVFQDCDENVTNPAGDWAAYVEDQTGTLWIHDVHFGGVHLTGGVQMQEPDATVVMRDVLFDIVYGSYTTNHAECIQTWSGPARLLIDGLECPTTYQGLFLLPNQSDSTTLETTWAYERCSSTVRARMTCGSGTCSRRRLVCCRCSTSRTCMTADRVSRVTGMEPPMPIMRGRT